MASLSWRGGWKAGWSVAWRVRTEIAGGAARAAAEGGRRAFSAGAQRPVYVAGQGMVPVTRKKGATIRSRRVAAGGGAHGHTPAREATAAGAPLLLARC